MNISTSILLRTLVWSTAFLAFLAVGALPLLLEGIHQFWALLGGLFVIFLAQGVASLIPTRKEIRNRTSSV